MPKGRVIRFALPADDPQRAITFYGEDLLRGRSSSEGGLLITGKLVQDLTTFRGLMER